MSSIKGNLIERRQFQNANQVITVDVKSKPKISAKTKVVHNPFKRNCALKKEIEKRQPKTSWHRPKEVENVNNYKMNRKIKEKSVGNVTLTEFIAAKNIHFDKVEKKNKQPSFSDQESVATSVSRRYPISKHLSNVRKNKDISLQCDLSQESATLPVRYLQANTKVKKTGVKELIGKSKCFQDNKTTPTNEKQQSDCSIDETHTPFGESALHLINQLRKRLRSRGDSESSDLVNQIEAYIGGIGSGKRLGTGVEEVFKFPSGNQNNVLKEKTSTIKNNYEITVENQRIEIKKLENTNEELRVLSLKLLEYHQKMVNFMPSPNNSTIEDEPVKLSKNKKWTVSTEDIQSIKLERDELVKIVQNQRNIIFDLEKKLHLSQEEKLQKGFDVNSMSYCSKKSLAESKLEPDQNLVPVRKRQDIKTHPAWKDVIRSDTDSAFEDRSISISDSKPSSLPKEYEERRYIPVLTDLGNMSETRWGDFIDEEEVSHIFGRLISKDIVPTADQLNVPNRGRVMESTRISNDNDSLKQNKLSKLEYSSQLYSLKPSKLSQLDYSSDKCSLKPSKLSQRDYSSDK